jgi:putative PIN family toxin of toxin-antitoxin system
VRIVLDTHIWLDWLVFFDPCVEPIREAHAARRVEIVIDAACEAELVRALGYDLGKHSLDVQAQADRIARCRSLAKRVEPGTAHGLPKCRDPDDQKFLELALASGAQVLVSKDQALLELAPRERRFRILAPREFRAL